LFIKKLLFFSCISLLMGGLRSQSIADARKLVYYERYDWAAHLLPEQDADAGDPNYAIRQLGKAIKRDKRNPDYYLAL